MKTYEFHFQNLNGITKNYLFKIIGDDIEELETAWVSILGHMYNKQYGMMRDNHNIEVRLFEDFSGLLLKASGRILYDEEKSRIYVSNIAVANWFEQLDKLDGILKEAFAKEFARKIVELRSKSPLIIVRESNFDKYSKDEDYFDEGDYDDEPDYERDTFDALTDGQYGDYDDFKKGGGDIGELKERLGF